MKNFSLYSPHCTMVFIFNYFFFWCVCVGFFFGGGGGGGGAGGRGSLFCSNIPKFLDTKIFAVIISKYKLS